MKLVVTILQNRRVALPRIFLEDALPRMRQHWDGTIETVLIQHRADASTKNSRFQSLQNAKAADLERVRRWTDDEGKYAAADDIITHDEVFRKYPHLPSVRRAVETALDRGADFHLLMEDDALVCDEECGNWPQYFGPSEIGVFRYWHYCNAAFLVMRPSFSRRILPGLRDYGSWSERSRLERFFFRHMRTTRTHLNPAAAVRSHPRNYPFTGDAYLADFVRKLAPDKLSLLELDFGPAISSLEAPDAETMWYHASLDNKKFTDNLLQSAVRWVEERWKYVEDRERRGPYDGGWPQVLDHGQ